MKTLSFLLMNAVAPMWAGHTASSPVEMTHKNGSFSGQLAVSMNGSMNKAKVGWTAAIRNTSPHRLFRATFCVKAFDFANQELKPGGKECVLTMRGSNWEPNALLNFKGKQNIKIRDGKSPVLVKMYAIIATEVLLDELDLQAKQTATTDLDKAIRQLPTEALRSAP